MEDISKDYVFFLFLTDDHARLRSNEIASNIMYNPFFIKKIPLPTTMSFAINMGLSFDFRKNNSLYISIIFPGRDIDDKENIQINLRDFLNENGIKNDYFRGLISFKTKKGIVFSDEGLYKVQVRSEDEVLHETLFVIYNEDDIDEL